MTSTDDKLKPTQADKDCAARILGYGNWDAIFNRQPVDSSGIPPIPTPGLKWSAERGAEEAARHRIAATDTQVSKHSEPSADIQKHVDELERERIKAVLSRCRDAHPDTVAREIMQVRHRYVATDTQVSKQDCPDEDWFEEVISDTLDMDWRPRYAAKEIVRRWNEHWLPEPVKGEAIFTICVGGEQSSMRTQANGMEPQRAVELAIGVLKAEADDAANCPVHAHDGSQVSKHSELADRLERAMKPVSARQGGLFLQWKELDAILSALRQSPDAQVSSLVSALREAQNANSWHKCNEIIAAALDGINKDQK